MRAGPASEPSILSADLDRDAFEVADIETAVISSSATSFEPDRSSVALST